MTDIVKLAEFCADRISPFVNLLIPTEEVAKEIEAALRFELEVDPDWRGSVDVTASPRTQPE